MSKIDSATVLKLGRDVLDTEQAALATLATRLGQDFVAACQLLYYCRGRIIVSGMGKSGHIGSKIAATLASTGSPAFFLHPGEACHGDLGMILQQDVLLLISSSGATEELLVLLPWFKRFNLNLLAMTGNPNSILAQAATVHLDVSVAAEACPLGLAPTASSTAALAMGDALAVALLHSRGFSRQDFALFHPGGSLGRRQLLRVSDLMHSGDAIPQVDHQSPLGAALLEMNQKRLGLTLVTEQGQVVGLFTDGDLRRSLHSNADLRQQKIATLMTRHYKTITADQLAVSALQRMEQHKISALVVVDDKEQLCGLIHIHDLLQARLA